MVRLSSVRNQLAAKLPSRLSLVLSDQARSSMEALILEHGYTATELIHMGLSYAKCLIQEAGQGHEIMIIDKGGRAIKRLEVPCSRSARNRP